MFLGIKPISFALHWQESERLSVFCVEKPAKVLYAEPDAVLGIVGFGPQNSVYFKFKEIMNYD